MVGNPGACAGDTVARREANHLLARLDDDAGGGVPDREAGIDRTVAMAKLQSALNLDAGGATRLLWGAYQPWRLWIPFAAVGVASAIAIAIYAKVVSRYEGKEV